MEVSNPPLEESLPDNEGRPNRLDRLKARLKEAPPEVPPPFLPDVAAEISLDPIEVTVEKLPEEQMETSAVRQEARQKLEKVFEEEKPTELELEQRAETSLGKDDEDADIHGLASSIGDIIANMHQKTTDAHAAFQRPAAVAASWRDPVALLMSQPAMYRQAVLAGFAGALLAVGVFVSLKLI